MKQETVGGKKSTAARKPKGTREIPESKTAAKAAIQSKIKKAKAKSKTTTKARKSTSDEKTIEEEQLDQFIRDSQIRQGIRQNLLSFIDALPTPLAPYFERSRSLLQWEFPIPADLIRSIANDPATSPDPSVNYQPSYERPINTLVKGRGDKLVQRVTFKQTPMNVIAFIRTYNSLLFKYSYSESRAKALQALHALTVLSDAPVLIENLLHNDELVSSEEIASLRSEYQLPDSFIRLVEQYNMLLNSGPHRQLPPNQSSVTVGIREYKDPKSIQKQAHLAVKAAIASYHKSLGMLEKAEVKSRENEEEDEDELESAKEERTKDSRSEDVARATSRQVQFYRDEIQGELALRLRVDRETITRDQITSAILQAQNLPGWVFLLRFITEPVNQPNTRKLIGEIGNLDQFGRLFRRLTARDQIDFVTETLSRFPPAQYPNGPSKSLLSLLTQFYNRTIAWDPTAQSPMDDKLTTSPANEFQLLFKSLRTSELLHYREIIFGRISSLRESDGQSILEVYSGLLAIFTAYLVYDAEHTRVQISDETSTRPVIDADFILPWTSSTKEDVKLFISNNLSPRAVSTFNLPSSLTDDSLDNLRVKLIDGSWVNLLSHIQFLLSNFYHSLLPIERRFTLFVRKAIISALEESKVQLSKPEQINELDINISIPDGTLQELTDQLKQTQAQQDLAFSGEELIRRAYVLGLDVKESVRVAARDAESRLKERVRRGDLTPEELKAKTDEINTFVDEYTSISKRVGTETADLKRKRKEFTRAFETALQTITAAMEHTWESIRDDAWATLKQTKILKKAQRKELRRYIDQLLSTRRTEPTKKKKSKNPSEVVLEHEAWEDAEEESIVPSEKLSLAREVYLERFDQLVKEAETQGQVLTEQEAQEQARNDATSQGILTIEEQTLIASATRPRGGKRTDRTEGMLSSALESQRKRIAYTQTRTDLTAITRKMPDAIRMSLAETVRDVSSELESRGHAHIGKYYKFVSAVLIASWNAKKEGTDSASLLKSIELEYTRTRPRDQQVELAFARKIIELIREGQQSKRPVTWNDLLKFTIDYTQNSTMLIRNPLQQQTGRRKRRYDKLFNKIVTQGEIGIIRREISEPLPSYVKECVAAHQLKPWLDIKHIEKWMFLVADPKGRKRDEMDLTERAFFNIPQGDEIAVLTPTGGKLYFYKPTTAYWIMHCKSHHMGDTAPSCNTNDLIGSFTGTNPQFYELMVRPPFGKAFGKMSVSTGSEIVFHYSEDNKRVKFLSMDPTVYEKECAWFAERYTGLEGTLDSIRSSKLKHHPDIRRQGRWAIKSALSNLRLKYGKINPLGQGMTQSQENDLAESSTRLEQALYDFVVSRAEKRSRISVYSYLKALYELIIPIDVTDPIGMHAKFYQNMLAQCADSYYPHLLNSFPTAQSRFPEIFLLPSSNSADLLKEKVASYIEKKIDILTQRSVLLSLSLSAPESQLDSALMDLNTKEMNLSKLSSPERVGESELDAKLTALIQQGESVAVAGIPLSISALFTKEGLQSITHLPNLTLKNICVNADDYKDLDDSWLVYYNKSGRVYCISKLQLASLAEAKEYTFNGVEFSKDFVDGFGSYADFASEELGRQTQYIKALTSALASIPENKTLFQDLVSNMLMFGSISADDVAQIMRQISLAGGSKSHKIINENDAFLIMIVKNKLQEIVNEFISAQIVDMTEAFIDENRNDLQVEINSGHFANQSADPLADEYKEEVFGPIVDAIIRSIETTSDFRVSGSDRTLIEQIIRKKFSPRVEIDIPKLKTSKCAACRAHLSKQAITPQTWEGAPVYRTFVQQVEDDQTRTKLLAFCSQECFSEYKIKEPTPEEANFSRLQNAVNTLTASYLTYNQMVLWARFPSAWQLPNDPKALRRVIKDWAKIKGLSRDEVEDLLPTMAHSENFLGIYTMKGKDDPIPEEELWDKIRINPYFVPSVTEMLKDDKFEAFQILARTFDIPMYDGDDWETFYSGSPEELINAWKILRSKPAFVELLFSTVSTFNPYESQKFRQTDEESASTDLLSHLGREPKTIRVGRGVAEEVKEQVLEALRADYTIFKDEGKLKAFKNTLSEQLMGQFPDTKSAELSTLISETVNSIIGSRAQELRVEIARLLSAVADLNIEVLNDPDRLKVIRDEIINGVANQFPELGLGFNMRKIYKIFTLRKTLRVWFTNHMLAHQLHAEVELVFPENRGQHTLSSERMIQELSGKCRKQITPNALSTWTIGVINAHRDKYGNKAPDQTRFQVDFYPALKKAYYCTSLNKLEEQHAKYVFNLEKVSAIVDETAAEIIEARQHEARAAEEKELRAPLQLKPGQIPRHKLKLSQRGLLAPTVGGPDVDIKERMRQIATGEVKVPEVLIMKEELKTRVEILAKLQELRRSGLKQVRDEKRAGQRAKGENTRSGFEEARARLISAREDKWVSLQPNAPVKAPTTKEQKAQEQELKELLATTNRMLDIGANVNQALGAIDQTTVVPLENIIELRDTPMIEEINVADWDENQDEVEEEVEEEEVEEGDYGDESDQE